MKNVVNMAVANGNMAKQIATKRYSHSDIEIVALKTKLCKLKNQAHFFFDKIWIYGYMNRNDAYLWLSKHLGVDEFNAHMRSMGKDDCKRVIIASIKLLNDMRRIAPDYNTELRHPYYQLLITNQLKPKEGK